MKPLKKLALAAIAALSLTALVGAGSAQATTLFTDPAKTIDYPAGTTLHLTLVSGTSLALTPGTCTDATISATTTNTTGAAITATLNVFARGGCSETTHTVANGSLEFKYTSGSNAEAVSKGTSTTVQIFGVSCTYGTGEGTKLGTVTGGAAPVLSVNTTLAKVAGGFLCPATTGFHGQFVITSPHAVYFGP
ncbi:MAG TPA: hypothetical protein VN733_05725 [Solirubrobacterales bacterium]|nr:hypothetical protein [Solirubrobacterales bacterium]